jgi:hypothetical protein
MGWFAVKANAIWRQQPIVENPSSTTPLDSGSLDRSARWGFEGMFVPSASRSFDYYVSSGVEQDPSNRWDSALEAGLRIRATIFNWIPNHSIKRYLGGFRIGIRANNIFNSTESFKNIHLVFEAGGGSW